MDRLDKSPDDNADAMAERLDNPSMRAESRPEEDPTDDIGYGYLLLLALACERAGRVSTAMPTPGD